MLSANPENSEIFWQSTKENILRLIAEYENASRKSSDRKEQLTQLKKAISDLLIDYDSSAQWRGILLNVIPAMNRESLLSDEKATGDAWLIARNYFGSRLHKLLVEIEKVIIEASKQHQPEDFFITVMICESVQLHDLLERFTANMIQTGEISGSGFTSDSVEPLFQRASALRTKFEPTGNTKLSFAEIKEVAEQTLAMLKSSWWGTIFPTYIRNIRAQLYEVCNRIIAYSQQISELTSQQISELTAKIDARDIIARFGETTLERTVTNNGTFGANQQAYVDYYFSRKDLKERHNNLTPNVS
jgi:hypothetical protein